MTVRGCLARLEPTQRCRDTQTQIHAFTRCSQRPGAAQVPPTGAIMPSVPVTTGNGSGKGRRGQTTPAEGPRAAHGATRRSLGTQGPIPLRAAANAGLRAHPPNTILGARRGFPGGSAGSAEGRPESAPSKYPLRINSSPLWCGGNSFSHIFR